MKGTISVYITAIWFDKLLIKFYDLKNLIDGYLIACLLVGEKCEVQIEKLAKS